MGVAREEIEGRPMDLHPVLSHLHAFVSTVLPHPPRPTKAPTSAVPSQSSPSRICVLGPAACALCPRSRPATAVNLFTPVSQRPLGTRQWSHQVSCKGSGHWRESGRLLRCQDARTGSCWMILLAVSSLFRRGYSVAWFLPCFTWR